MKYDVLITKKAKKQILSLNKSEYNGIKKKINELSNFPEISNLKRLKGFRDYFRVRVAKYRILFIVNYQHHTIYVVKVEKRSKAYKKL